jgi:transcriptional regulator with XRE-family HTH domain
LNNTLVGLNIKTARKMKKLTQQQLANGIGKTESTIRKYENGSIEVPNSVLEQIASVLNTDIATLIGIFSPYEDENLKRRGFERMLLDMDYLINYHDPEHPPFIKDPFGNIFALEWDDLKKFQEVSEAYIKYTIDSTLKNRELLRKAVNDKE